MVFNFFKMFEYIKAKLFGSLGGRCWIRMNLAKIISSFFPLQENKYFCISMQGKNYGCNVLALATYIQNKEPNAKIVWAFASIINKENPTLKGTLVKSFKYYWHLFTSKYVLSNQRFSYSLYPYKRTGQIYLQMWHGTALKRIEKDTIMSKGNIQDSIYDSKLIDVFISGSHFMTEIYKRSFWYEGDIEETGTPRNDIFFGNHPNVINKVCKFLKVDNKDRFVLYAPTFRKNYDLEQYNIDSDLIIDSLQKNMGGKWHFVVRLHPNLLMDQKIARIHEKFPRSIDGSLYPDMQELLYVADILITDYSATMFDFMYSKKPCFLYIPDVDTYDRGFYWKIKDLPFPSFKESKHICDAINNFDNQSYIKAINSFLIQIGDCESGHASEKIYHLLKGKK